MKPVADRVHASPKAGGIAHAQPPSRTPWRRAYRKIVAVVSALIDLARFAQLVGACAP
jgi:hypothetical protein